jgi:hypothetical protein
MIGLLVLVLGKASEFKVAITDPLGLKLNAELGTYNITHTEN